VTILARWLSFLGLAVGLTLSQPAQAISFYAEILTNDDFPLFPDITASATLTVDFDPLTFDWTGMTSAGGLGTGYVDETTPLNYTHLFDPTPDSANVLQAWLFVSVIDDELDITPETAVVELDGGLWQTGQATLNLFFGDITALGLITTDGDTFQVEVFSDPGSGNRDFLVVASAIKVKFEPVPEPDTLALLGLGLAALAAGRAKRAARA